MNTPKDMLENLAGFSAKLFRDTGEVMPMWVLVADGVVMPIVAPFGNREEKDASVEMVRAKAKEIGARLVGFMAEAWTVSVPKTADVQNMVPSEHEDRREVIHIYVEDKMGHTASGQYFILRPENGKPKLSEFKDLSGDGEMGGRFANILERAS